MAATRLPVQDLDQMAYTPSPISAMPLQPGNVQVQHWASETPPAARFIRGQFLPLDAGDEGLLHGLCR